MPTFDPNHPWLTGFRSGILLALAVLTTMEVCYIDCGWSNPVLESILVAWTGWIFSLRTGRMRALLVGLGALGAALGTFIAALGLGGGISGAV